jgi:hypothetical protein
MKTLCTFLAAAALLSAPAGAVADGSYSPAPGELAGRQAVQFSIEGFLTLSEFQGQMFSYQKFLTDSRAIRVAAGLSLDLTESDLDIEYYSGEQTGSAELSSWRHSGTLKVQMLFYQGDGPLRFFWGGGPKVTYSDRHTENVHYSPYGDELHFVYNTSDIDTWRFGLQGLAGVEWFINRMFSTSSASTPTTRTRTGESIPPPGRLSSPRMACGSDCRHGSEAGALQVSGPSPGECGEPLDQRQSARGTGRCRQSDRTESPGPSGDRWCRCLREDRAGR